ncbi:MAG TPA: sulfotransferase [Candidatus Binatia bacterium]|nr:sulfotransferase [Candidatus Binatia bacterium]
MGFIRKLFGGSKATSIFVVSGLPRSGTSMMMKMLEAGGIPPLTDEIREADSDNPRGYYEFERVKKLDKGDAEWLAQAEGKAVKVISALLKHLPGGYHYKIIFMQRHMPEILASQRKMLVHRGEDPASMDDARMADLFAKHLSAVEEQLSQQENADVLYVHYSDALQDPQTTAERVADFLGKELDVEAMVGVVDPALYRNRREELA